MALVLLEEKDTNFDEAKSKLERPGADPDFKAAAKSIQASIERATEKFAFEVTTGSQVQEFEELTRWIERSRPLVMQICSSVEDGRPKRISLARAAQQVLNAVDVHVRLLQNVRDLGEARVGASAEILALSSSFSRIESSLDNYLRAAGGLLALLEGV